MNIKGLLNLIVAELVIIKLINEKRKETLAYKLMLIKKISDQ